VTPNSHSEKLMKLDSDGELGLHRMPSNEAEIPAEISGFSKTRHRFISYSGEYIYHIAIIDYLQVYNWDKRSEHYAKTIFRGRNAEISSVPPNRYMKRYVEFMGNEVIINDKNRGSKSYKSE